MQSLDLIWDEVLKNLKENNTKTVYELWFADTKLLFLDGYRAAISIDSDLKKGIIENRYAEKIAKALFEIIGFEPDIEVYSTENGELSTEIITNEKENKEKEAVRELETERRLEETEETYQNSGAEYTFDNFIVGSSNKMAHAACTAIAKKPASSFNPLFIYGASGLGKTHLLYAIMNELKHNFPGIKIVYIKGEDFTNQLIESIANETTVSFRNKYRKADVLLIDDIQFIAGKESTQEEFFHTFNALYEDHKQIILVADRPPKEMKTLEDRLRSRFEWGLMVDVQPPDYELRLAILKNKAKMMDIVISPAVLQFLAENLRSNIRQLEGAVKKLSAQSFLSGLPITEEMAKSCISELSSGQEPVGQTVERIISKVANKYSLAPEDIKSRKKTKNIASARHISIYLIRNITDMSLPSIGKIFDRDHSTVISSITVVENEMKKSPMFEAEIKELLKEVKDI